MNIYFTIIIIMILIYLSYTQSKREDFDFLAKLRKRIVL